MQQSDIIAWLRQQSNNKRPGEDTVGISARRFPAIDVPVSAFNHEMVSLLRKGDNPPYLGYVKPRCRRPLTLDFDIVAPLDNYDQTGETVRALQKIDYAGAVDNWLQDSAMHNPWNGSMTDSDVIKMQLWHFFQKVAAAVTAVEPPNEGGIMVLSSKANYPRYSENEVKIGIHIDTQIMLEKNEYDRVEKDIAQSIGYMQEDLLEILGIRGQVNSFYDTRKFSNWMLPWCTKEGDPFAYEPVIMARFEDSCLEFSGVRSTEIENVITSLLWPNVPERDPSYDASIRSGDSRSDADSTGVRSPGRSKTPKEPSQYICTKFDETSTPIMVYSVDEYQAFNKIICDYFSREAYRQRHDIRWYVFQIYANAIVMQGHSESDMRSLALEFAEHVQSADDFERKWSDAKKFNYSAESYASPLGVASHAKNQRDLAHELYLWLYESTDIGNLLDGIAATKPSSVLEYIRNTYRIEVGDKEIYIFKRYRYVRLLSDSRKRNRCGATTDKHMRYFLGKAVITLLHRIEYDQFLCVEMGKLLISGKHMKPTGMNVLASDVNTDILRSINSRVHHMWEKAISIMQNPELRSDYFESDCVDLEKNGNYCSLEGGAIRFDTTTNAWAFETDVSPDVYLQHSSKQSFSKVQGIYNGANVSQRLLDILWDILCTGPCAREMAEAGTPVTYERLTSQECSVYTLRTLAMILNGNSASSLAKIFILHGPGGDGKSTIFSLMSHAFSGEYVLQDTPILFEHSTRNSEGAQPRYKSYRKPRLVLFSESVTKPDMTRIKNMTGRDEIRVRDMYSGTQVKFTFQGYIMWAMNNYRPFKGTTFGIETSLFRRITCIPMPNHFVANPSKLNERKLDPRTNNELPRLGADMIALLMRVYMDCGGDFDSSDMPESILRETLDFRAISNFIYGYCRDNIIQDDGPGLTAAEVYEHMKTFSGHRGNSEYDVHKYLAQQYGSPGNDGRFPIRIAAQMEP